MWNLFEPWSLLIPFDLLFWLQFSECLKDLKEVFGTFQALRHSREPSGKLGVSCLEPSRSSFQLRSLYASHPTNWPNAGTLTDWEVRPFFCFVGFWDFIVRCPKSLGVGQVPVFYMFLFLCQKVRVKVVACVCRLLIVVHCCCWTVVGCCCILPGLVVCGCLYAAPWDDPHLVKLIH